jgi:hypothetical protein
VLDLGKFLMEIRAEAQRAPVFARMALMFQQIQDGVNQIGAAVGVDPTGHIQPPSPPQNISVKAANGTVHVTLTDNSQRNRSLNYFLEHDTNPAFPNPHVVHLVASRGTFLNLPAKDDDNNAQSWYFRAYSMYPGSTQPSSHIVFGGTSAPTPVSVGGTTQLTPLPSTGAGTASTTGQQGGKGFGQPQFSNPTR